MSGISWFLLGCACGTFSCFLGSVILIIALPREAADVVVEWFAPDKLEPKEER